MTSASPQVQFRAVPPLESALAARVRPGVTRNGAAQEATMRYFALLATELATVRLSRAETLFLCDTLSDVSIDSTWWPQAAPALLAAQVAAADGTPWDVDADEVSSAVSTFTPTQAFAVAEAASRWDSTEGDEDQRLATLGLRPVAASVAGGKGGRRE